MLAGASFDPNGTVPSLGTRWPAHATSTGKVLLAYRGNGQAYPRTLPGLTPRTIVDPAAMARELSRVRRRGCGGRGGRCAYRVARPGLNGRSV